MEREKLTAKQLREAYAGGRRDFTRVYVIPDEGSAGADLAGADLTGAYLAGADLARAYLAGADLTGAYLAGAYLARADLAGACLAGADLADADLTGAYLARADLAGACLAGADLARADLAGAYLAGADLTDAEHVPAGIAAGPAPEGEQPPREPWRRLTPEERKAKQLERAQRFRERYPSVPVVENLDARILAAVTAKPETFDMGTWHGRAYDDAGNFCGTTHCRAGWAITLAGDAGRALESEVGSLEAGRRIYRASTGRVPHFFGPTDLALADIRRCAAEQTGGAAPEQT